MLYSYADPTELKAKQSCHDEETENGRISPPYGTVIVPPDLPDRRISNQEIQNLRKSQGSLLCCTAAKAAKRTYAVHY